MQIGLLLVKLITNNQITTIKLERSVQQFTNQNNVTIENSGRSIN